jgi:4-amino-4-deoxy-L-arabinose transferase-like glycosyltransferase
MKKKIFLVGIIILAFLIRLYRINFPLADWHSWRQADTAAVSRNFVKYGFDLLHPRFDDLSNVASGKENPQGYRFVEFPVYNAIHGLLYKLFPFWSLEVWGRLVSILFSLISLIFLFLIVENFLNTQIALFSAFFFAVLPFNIYYSRVILPEPMMVMTALGMIYFTVKVLGNHELRITNFYLILGIIFAAISFLLKPYSLVFVLPIFYLCWRKWHFNYLRWISAFIFFLISLLPFLWWRWWMSQYPEGIPAYNWLFNEGGIRFKGAWFYWLFADRLGRLILGYWGLPLFILGLMARPTKKEGLFFYSWLMAILAYFIIIAGGNVKHDYYQVIVIPIICIFLAKGVYFLLTAPKEFFLRFMCHFLAFICILFMLGFSWYYVRDFFNINNQAIIEAGRAVDNSLPAEAKIIAPYGGDTTFLYQTRRRGWPIGIEIDKFITLGAEYYVNVNIEDPEVKLLAEKYCVIQRTPQWIIIDLRNHCVFQE